jgi:tight adherence protein C
VTALLGLAAAGLLLLAVTGARLARADALEGWDVGDIALLRDETRKRERVGPLDALAARWAPGLGRLLGPRVRGELRRRIDLAGRPDGLTLDSFLRLLTKYAVLMGTAALALLLLGSLFGALLALVLAPVLPLSRIVGSQRRRRERIDADLPDFLDVLAVAVAAGIGFRSALGRVAARTDGPLQEELLFTLHQLDVGVPRRQAFEALRGRCDSDAVSSFVTAFVQAEELGAPLAESLGQIALDARREASQQARRAAARTVPRVTLVVSMVLVPAALILVVVGLFLGSGVEIGGLLAGS